MTDLLGFPAKVVCVPDDYSIVINRGAEHNIKLGQRFIIYGLSRDEITDPDTGESLGFLEIVRGTGVVSHVQPKMATIASDKYQRGDTVKRVNAGVGALLTGFGGEEIIESGERKQLAFDFAELGDLAKPI
ncbi:hypothetical protein [Maridesulfovibrio sp.]|uniref:hypothetical protein n=1 Tax=unclassified Maridesulfovibrio TaxID=2794999 RepID=UPI003AFFA0DC